MLFSYSKLLSDGRVTDNEYTASRAISILIGCEKARKIVKRFFFLKKIFNWTKKCQTWDLQNFLPGELAFETSCPMNSINSAGFESANLGFRGEHITLRQTKATVGIIRIYNIIKILETIVDHVHQTSLPSGSFTSDIIIIIFLNLLLTTTKEATPVEWLADGSTVGF